jgi:hypothetical protein
MTSAVNHYLGFLIPTPEHQEVGLPRRVTDLLPHLLFCLYPHPTAQVATPAGCGKTIFVEQNFDDLHVWGKPGLSGPSGSSHATNQTR